MQFFQSKRNSFLFRNDQDKEGYQIFRSCDRFRSKEKDKIDNQEDSIVYLHMRTLNCSRHKALKYFTTPHCRIDTTIGKFGPSICHNLNIKVDPVKNYYGWQIQGQVEHKLDIKMDTSVQNILINDDSEQLLKNLEKFEQNIQYENQNKINNLKKFYQEDLNKINFSEMSKCDLISRLKNINQENQQSYGKLKNILQMNGIKFIEAAKEINEFSNQYKKGNKIIELEAFQQIIPQQDRLKFQKKQKLIKIPSNLRPIGYDIFRSRVSQEMQNSYKDGFNNSIFQGQVIIESTSPQNRNALKIYRDDFNQSIYLSDSCKKESSLNKFILGNQQNKIKQNITRDNLKKIRDAARKITLKNKFLKAIDNQLVEKQWDQSYIQNYLQFKADTQIKEKNQRGITNDSKIFAGNNNSYQNFDQSLDKMAKLEIKKITECSYEKSFGFRIRDIKEDNFENSANIETLKYKYQIQMNNFKRKVMNQQDNPYELKKLQQQFSRKIYDHQKFSSKKGIDGKLQKQESQSIIKIQLTDQQQQELDQTHKIINFLKSDLQLSDIKKTNKLECIIKNRHYQKLGS